MTRAAAASARLAVAAALALGCLTISAAPALAAHSQTAGRVAAPAVSRVAADLPADGRIAFTDFTTNQLYTVNPDGTGLVQLTHEPAGIAARWPSWSRDGSRILFVRWKPSNGAGRIWI